MAVCVPIYVFPSGHRPGLYLSLTVFILPPPTPLWALTFLTLFGEAYNSVYVCDGGITLCISLHVERK